MGFEYYSEQQRVRINLSERTILTIQEDMEQFNIASRSAFMNIVFQNFYTEADASIALRLEEKGNQLRELCAGSDPNRPETHEKIFQLLLDAEEKRLLGKIEKQKRNKNHNESYKSKTIYRINNENLEYLKSEDCLENRYYSYHLGFYLKCILEEYASLPYINREHILFKDKYRIVQEALDRGLALKVEFENKKSYKVWPHEIKADSLYTREYLIGFVLDKGNESAGKYCASFRIPNIKKIQLLHQSGRLTKDEIHALEEAVTNRTVQFLVGNDEEIRIRLSDEGVHKYKSQLYMRPPYDKELTDGNEYVFHCTPRQAEYYFFKFGNDAEILAPPELRMRFKTLYEDALNIYRNQV